MGWLALQLVMAPTPDRKVTHMTGPTAPSKKYQIVLSFAIASFGLGVFVTAFAGWVAGGLEASDANGDGSTLPGEWLLQGAGLLLAVAGAVWLGWAAHAGGTGRGRQILRSIPIAVVALGAGFVSGGAAGGLYRQATGAPNSLDYVTPLATWFLTAGAVLVLVGLAATLVRNFSAHRTAH